MYYDICFSVSQLFENVESCKHMSGYIITIFKCFITSLIILNYNINKRQSNILTYGLFKYCLEQHWDLIKKFIH